MTGDMVSSLVRAPSVISSLVLAVVLMTPRHGNAGLVVEVSSATANAGSSGNTFEVDLANTGPDVTIGAFSFGLSTTSPDVSFTEADISTTTFNYIFTGDSLFGPTIDTSSGTSLIASDLSLSGLGATLATGQTLGLGHVLFDIGTVAPSEIVTVTLVSGDTSLSDAIGNDVPIDSFGNGSITINGSTGAVPEPSTLSLATMAAFFGSWYVGRRRTLKLGDEDQWSVRAVPNRREVAARY